MNGYFITGTDTEIGKTYVLSQLFACLNSEDQPWLVLKPVAAGLEDVLTIQSLQPEVLEPICAWSYPEPIAPYFSAERQGQRMEARAIVHWCLTRAGQQRVLIEGAGGLLMPLNQTESWVQVIQHLHIPVILVVGLRLGCMNHALLTDRVMQVEGLSVAGWVANHLSAEVLCDREMIETLRGKMQAPYLGEVMYQGNFIPSHDASVNTSQFACCMTP